MLFLNVVKSVGGSMDVWTVKLRQCLGVSVSSYPIRSMSEVQPFCHHAVLSSRCAIHSHASHVLAKNGCPVAPKTHHRLQALALAAPWPPAPKLQSASRTSSRSTAPEGRSAHLQAHLSVLAVKIRRSSHPR